ncbi:MAG: RpiB/LacA/LacB family sugar-phosphate isomerase [Patescibacteria group bacterium]|jgi:RpiB/LacA/LacB family sugar-phosphate isomerase|nr:RpiB/LacA/LacB family sugar-phosphate isomerase [Patescibacteria group bacterium]
MTIYLAADHAGFALKDRLKAHLSRLGNKLVDLTPIFKDGDDYPGVAKKLTGKLSKAGRGILFCGSGVGVCIAANRAKGIRAAVGHSTEEVKQAREHNDINVLCLSGWNHADESKAAKMIDAFLKTRASTAARHVRRVKQLG